LPLSSLDSSSSKETLRKPATNSGGALSNNVNAKPFEYLTGLQRHSAAVVPVMARRDSTIRLPFIPNDLARCSLVRIVEEELIAVGIIDHQKSVAPRTLFDRNALGLEFRAQRVQRDDLGLALGIQGNEHQTLANLLRPMVGQNKRAALSIDLCDARFAIL